MIFTTRNWDVSSLSLLPFPSSSLLFPLPPLPPTPPLPFLIPLLRPSPHHHEDPGIFVCCFVAFSKPQLLSAWDVNHFPLGFAPSLVCLVWEGPMLPKLVKVESTRNGTVIHTCRTGMSFLPPPLLSALSLSPFPAPYPQR